MKNCKRIIGIVMASLLLGTVANVAVADPDWCDGPGMMGGYGPGYGMGQGMMGGYGPGYGMGPGMMGHRNYRDLNLSADQQSKIAQIRKAMRTKQSALMDDLLDAHDALQDLYDADKQDAAAINKQYKAIDDLRRQMVDNAVDAHNQINAILTKEQREKLKDRGRGYGPMMRGY